jgi:pSer/pThr/pTyr-binding forkhead associated (FHA) protein
MPFLIRKVGDPQGTDTQVIELVKPTMTMGRHRECDCILIHSGASRLHATLRLEDSKCYLSDSTSRNGTYLNHARLVGEQQLLDGDLIQICDTFFVFRETLGTVKGSKPPPPDSSEIGPVPSTVDYPEGR